MVVQEAIFTPNVARNCLSIASRGSIGTIPRSSSFSAVNYILNTCDRFKA